MLLVQPQMTPTCTPNMMANSKDQSHLCPHKRNAFAVDAALVGDTHKGFQCLMDKFSKECKEFDLNISIKVTEVMAHNAENPLQSILMFPTSLGLTTSNTWDQPSLAICRSMGRKCPHWESSHSNGQTKQKGLAKHQSDNAYHTQGLSCMCNQHTPLLKRSMDTLC